MKTNLKARHGMEPKALRIARIELASTGKSFLS